jgi:hypothetical protein
MTTRRGRRAVRRLAPLAAAGVTAAVVLGAFGQALPAGAASRAGAPPRSPRPVARRTLPPFAWTESPVTAATVPYTWHPGCPVGPASLRLLHLRYVGFDGRAYTGTMVVNVSVVTQVVKVFATLYGERFPIHKMVPEDAFHGSDPASMAADNTSGFNCRYAVAPGPPQWSVHAFGEAIDVDPVQNPYLEGGKVQPADGARYVDRARVRPGMAVPGGELVEAFASVGWYWGGRWTASPDYQHFSSTGG